MIEVATVHRVQGLLWATVESGVVEGSDELVAEARERLTGGLRTCLAVEESAVLAIDVLQRAGVEVRALKGMAIAHLDQVHPAERLFGDVDLLIRPDECRLALATLSDAGFVRAEPAVRGWWERRFGKAIVLHSPLGSELDLHLRLTSGYFGERLDHDALWSRPGPSISLAGITFDALDTEDRLLHACCHSVLGGGSGLRAVHDVAQLVLVSHADWQTTAERARRDGVDLVVARGVQTAWADLGLDPGHPAAIWSAAHVPDPQQATALDASRAALDGAGWKSEGHSMLAALGPIDRMRFLAGLAVPSSGSLHARGRTRRRHLEQGVAAMRGAR